MYHLQPKSYEGDSIDLAVQRLNVGRDQDNNLTLDNERVSGFHASLFFDNGQVELTDLGSTNGTYVNGQKVQGRVTLKSWDVIRFAEVEFEVIDPAGRRPTSVQQAVTSAVAPTTEKPVIDGPEIAKLKLISGGGYPGEVSVCGTVEVGRTLGNSLQIDRETISSNHARLLVRGDRLEVTDQGSTNGTYVNGTKVVSKILDHGDTVRFDEVEYLVEYPGGDVNKTMINAAVQNNAKVAATAVNITVKEAAMPPVMPPPISSSPLTSRDSGEQTAPRSDRSIAPPVMPPPSLGAPLFAAETASSVDGGMKWLLFSFDGRIGRMKFFLTMLVVGSLNMALSTIVQLMMFGEVASMNPYSPNYASGAVSGIFVSLIFLWTGLAVTIKRFHDLDRSGHWSWLLIVPFVNIYAAILLYFVAGTHGDNCYGEPPM